AEATATVSRNGPDPRERNRRGYRKRTAGDLAKSRARPPLNPLSPLRARRARPYLRTTPGSGLWFRTPGQAVAEEGVVSRRRAMASSYAVFASATVTSNRVSNTIRGPPVSPSLANGTW